MKYSEVYPKIAEMLLNRSEFQMNELVFYSFDEQNKKIFDSLELLLSENKVKILLLEGGKILKNHLEKTGKKRNCTISYNGRKYFFTIKIKIYNHCMGGWDYEGTLIELIKLFSNLISEIKNS